MQIVGTITNQLDHTQEFVYFFQVKDSANYIESLSWVKGELSAKQSLDVSQSWIPDHPGNYTIEAFVWNSFNELFLPKRDENNKYFLDKKRDPIE